jgi:hypothetical protein
MLFGVQLEQFRRAARTAQAAGEGSCVRCGGQLRQLRRTAGQLRIAAATAAKDNRDRRRGQLGQLRRVVGTD